MDIETKKLIEDWNFIRGNAIAFIESLSNEQLQSPLPRPNRQYVL
jgi:hypothetical protein